MKGQLSAEMLILIAVVVAVVAIAATRLISTAKASSEQVGNQSQEIGSMAEKSMKAKAGEFCVKDEGCLSDSCGCPDPGCSGGSGDYVCD
jgi:uncharacterized protein (UPF0333 family)